VTPPADKATLTKNTAYSVIGYLVSYALPIFLVPYVIWRVPLADYGVWIAVSVVGMWLSRCDLGIWAAIPREVAECRAREDTQGLRTLAATWWIFDGVVSVSILIAAVAFGKLLLPYVVPKADEARAFPVLFLVSVQSALAPILRHQVQTLGGLQRLDLVHKMSIPVALLSAAATVLFLELGWGIEGLAASGAFFGVVQVPILSMLIAGVGHPKDLSPKHFSAGVLARLIRFGWKLEAGQAILQAFRSDRLLLMMTGFPSERVARYQFGAAVPDRLSGFVSVLSSAILPAATDLATRGDQERVRFLLMRGTKYHALAAFGLLGFAALFAPELLVLWLGRPFPDVVGVLRILTLGFGAWAVTCCAQAIAAALGRPGLQLAGGAAGLGLTVVLYIAVGRRYDYGHLAWAVTSGLALAQIAFMIGFRKVMAFRWREFAGNALLKPAVLALPLLAAYAAWRGLVAPQVPPVETRAQAAAVVVPAFAAVLVLGWLAARACRVLDAVDVGALKSLGRRIPA